MSTLQVRRRAEARRPRQMMNRVETLLQRLFMKALIAKPYGYLSIMDRGAPAEPLLQGIVGNAPIEEIAELCRLSTSHARELSMSQRGHREHLTTSLTSWPTGSVGAIIGSHYAISLAGPDRARAEAVLLVAAERLKLLSHRAVIELIETTDNQEHYIAFTNSSWSKR